MQNTQENKDIMIYQSNDGQISFDVNVLNETVWLTQKQMAELFDKNRKTITEHIGNIFKEGELQEEVTCRNFQHVTKHGAIKDKERNINVKYYNLDVIISVGYRVKSQRGTQFRIWATQILKSYMLNGYAINERRIQTIEDKIDNLSIELRAELKTEIQEINKTLLQIANRPISINNQITIGSNKLEEKIIELLNQLIEEAKSDKNLKSELEEVRDIIKTSPKDENTQNKLTHFFKDLGDNNSDLNKTIKGAGIASSIIKELVKLGSKFRDLFF